MVMVNGPIYDKKETSSTLNFTAGDRCLVHLLESEAGQLLNGQHVNLVDGIVRNGRLRCRFEVYSGWVSFEAMITEKDDKLQLV